MESNNKTVKIIATSMAGLMLTCQTGCHAYQSVEPVTSIEPAMEQTNSDVEEEAKANTESMRSSISKPQPEAETPEEINKLKIAEEITNPFITHAERMVDSAKVQLSEQEYEQTIEAVGEYTKRTGAGDQAEYINDFMDHTTTQYGEEAATKVLRACGYNCINEGIINTAKQCYEEAKDMNEFLDKLNQKGIGGGHLHFEGKHIIATYDQCYCTIGGQKDKLPGCYCQCSCGWFEKLFVEVVKKPVNVDIKESFILGQQQCTFDIMIDDL